MITKRNTHVYLTRLVLAVCLSTIAVPVSASTIIGFTGAYAVSNWTQVISGGSILTDDAPNAVTLWSANDHRYPGPTPPQSQDFLFTAFEPALIAFDWAFRSYDVSGPIHDPFYWLQGESKVRLTTSGVGDLCSPQQFTSGYCPQSGSAAFHVATGEVFGFRAHSFDSTEGAAVTTISNFSVAAPEPTSLLLLGTGLIAGALRRLRTKNVRGNP